jgi:hypothetical protein
MLNEHLTASEQQFLRWISWTALVFAVTVVFGVAWQVWVVQGRMAVLFHGKIHALPIPTRVMLAIHPLILALMAIGVSGVCLRLQTEKLSRVVVTLFHLLVIAIGFGCFLIAREAVMATLSRMAFGG